MSPSVARLSRSNMARTQSQDRPEFLEVEVDKVAETISSPRFVLGEENRNLPSRM
jgi:hypothetical protein